MKFCDLVQFMHHNYEEKANAGEFVAILIDAILDDVALEDDSSNPIYKLGKSTREAYYSGRQIYLALHSGGALQGSSGVTQSGTD